MRWLATLVVDLVRAVALLTAFVCGVAGLAAWGGAFAPQLDSLTHLAPLGLVGCFVALVLWLGTLAPEAPKAAGPLSVAGLIAWAGLIAPEAAMRVLAKRAAPAAETVKIVQFNIWDEDVEVWPKANWILAQNPDVVALEEVGPAARGLMTALAKRYPYKVTCESRPYPCSVVILSKTAPIADGHFSGPEHQPNTSWATFRTRAGDYTVFATHAVWPTPDGKQQAQLRSLTQNLERFDRANLILAGDFNSTPWSFAIRDFAHGTGLERRSLGLPSWPVGPVGRLRVQLPFAFLPIDHLFAGSAWRTVSVERGPRLGSDHLPLVAVLTRDAPEVKKRSR